jgi:hypothetical protein
MAFKLVSKNNMGIIVILILVILLSQSRFFDFLTETALGRMLMLVLIIFISYTNKLLGLLAVLFVIIAFNQYNMNTSVQSYNYYEGFDVSGNSPASEIIKDKVNILKAKEDILKQKLTALNNKNNSSQTDATTSSAVSGSTSNSESFGAREGFCMTDRESNILRGKQSNTIPVFNNTRDQDNNISPSDKSVFSNTYSSF